MSVSPGTVSRGRHRHGPRCICNLEPHLPVRGDEPGELIHIDINKLSRFASMGHRITGDRAWQNAIRGIGWKHLHSDVDDQSRLAYSEIYLEEPRGSCLAFLVNVLSFFALIVFRRHGSRVDRVMTHNRPAFKSRRRARALRRLTVARKRTRPCTLRTNGKVERFVRTSLREGAYARAYDPSEQRRKELPAFHFRADGKRPQGGINGRTPIRCLGLPEDSLLMLYGLRKL